MPKVLSLAWETILEIELAFEDKDCQPEDILELFRRLHNDVQNIHEELAVYINTSSWDRPTEPDNSLSMRDEHLDTVSAIESDKLTKSSVENLILIPSESERNPGNMCDVSFHDKSPPHDVLKDQFEDFSDSNDDSTSINDDSFSIDNIEYVEASPLNSELVSSEMISFVSLPDYEAFYDDHVKEISSGNTTTHFDCSLYDSFIFDLSINPFPPSDRSDFYEFADELAHIISLPQYDCFCFKNEPNSGDFTMDVVENIFPTSKPRVHVHNALPTHPTLQLNLDFILSSVSLFAYVVWIFLLFLSYLVAPEYILSFEIEDTIFDHGISSYHISSFMPDVSHRSGTFIKYNVNPKHLNGSPMEISFFTCSPIDQ
nr:hypothetical protein [Tanacetum cinerariifolium]